MYGLGQWLSDNVLLPFMYTLIDLILLGMIVILLITIAEHVKEIVS